MRYYEIIFVSNADLSEEDLEKLTERTKETIEKKGGEVVRIQQWGKKKLAYKVRKQTIGNYTLVNFVAPPDAIPELERVLKLDERVLKFLTVKLKDKVDIEELRHEIEEERKKTEPETEPPQQAAVEVTESEVVEEIQQKAPEGGEQGAQVEEQAEPEQTTT